MGREERAGEETGRGQEALCLDSLELLRELNLSRPLESRDPGVPVSRAGQAGAARRLSCAGSRIRTEEERGVVTSSCQWHRGPGHVRAGK